MSGRLIILLFPFVAERFEVGRNNCVVGDSIILLLLYCCTVHRRYRQEEEGQEQAGEQAAKAVEGGSCVLWEGGNESGTSSQYKE